MENLKLRICQGECVVITISSYYLTNDQVYKTGIIDDDIVFGINNYEEYLFKNYSKMKDQ